MNPAYLGYNHGGGEVASDPRRSLGHRIADADPERTILFVRQIAAKATCEPLIPRQKRGVSG